MDVSRTVSKIKGLFWSKIANFPTRFI